MDLKDIMEVQDIELEDPDDIYWRFGSYSLGKRETPPYRRYVDEFVQPEEITLDSVLKRKNLSETDRMKLEDQRDRIKNRLRFENLVPKKKEITGVYLLKKAKLLNEYYELKKEKRINDLESVEFEHIFRDFFAYTESQILELNEDLKSVSDYAMYWHTWFMQTCEKTQEMCKELYALAFPQEEKPKQAMAQEEKKDQGQSRLGSDNDQLYKSVGKWVTSEDHFGGLVFKDINYEQCKSFTAVLPKPYFTASWLDFDDIGWWQCQRAQCQMFNRVATRTETCYWCHKTNMFQCTHAGQYFQIDNLATWRVPWVLDV